MIFALPWELPLFHKESKIWTEKEIKVIEIKFFIVFNHIVLKTNLAAG